MGLLFTLAIVVAAAALGWKRWRRTKSFTTARYEEDDAPRVVMSHAEIEPGRCTCGGKRIQEGEGPVSRAGDGDLWRVLTRCGSCGRRRALLFKVAS